jgi:hypothetical protein
MASWWYGPARTASKYRSEGVDKMSLKYTAQKVSENHYVLPKVGRMKVEAHAFLSEALYQGSEEQVWPQIANGASYEGVIGAYLMPDTHTGYGVPVGSVIVTEDTIIQGGSGYDISCGVLYMKAPLTAGAVKSKHNRERWVKEVERRIATGKGHHRPDLMPKFSRRQGDDILRLRGQGSRRQRRPVRGHGDAKPERGPARAALRIPWQASGAPPSSKQAVHRGGKAATKTSWLCACDGKRPEAHRSSA